MLANAQNEAAVDHCRRANGGLYYDPDGSGAQAKVQFAVLDNHAVLTSADFLVA